MLHSTNMLELEAQAQEGKVENGSNIGLLKPGGGHMLLHVCLS